MLDPQEGIATEPNPLYGGFSLGKKKPREEASKALRWVQCVTGAIVAITTAQSRSSTTTGMRRSLWLW